MRGLLGYLGRHHWGMLGTFIALGGTAYAVGGGSNNSIHACVNQASGATRIARHCHPDEYAVTWAKTGQQGPAGPSDGYFSSKGKITVPPGNYIAHSACTASIRGPGSAPLVFGEAVSWLSTDPTPLDRLSQPPPDTTESYASVPNQGTRPDPGGMTGSATLANVASFYLPNGGTIYGACAPFPSTHGFGGSAVEFPLENADVTAIRVGSLHTG